MHRGDGVDEVEVVRVVRVAVVGCPRAANGEVRELNRQALEMASAGQLKIPVPSANQGRRHQQRQLRAGPRVHGLRMQRPKDLHHNPEMLVSLLMPTIEELAPPLEPPLIATLPGAAYLLSTRYCLTRS